MNQKLETLLDQYEYHNRLFKNVLLDIEHHDALIRINGITNHIVWLSGNLVHIRHKLAKGIGLEIKEPFPELFLNSTGIKDDVTYPKIAAINEEWNKISPVLKEGLSNLADEALEEQSIIETPQIKHHNLMGSILFIIDRESSVIGQMAFIRKALGYEAMKYN